MNLSGVEECSHTCVFCSRQICSLETSFDAPNNLSKFTTFTKMLGRFVRSTNELGQTLVEQLDMECLSLGCCSDCLIITSNFCEAFDKFKCLELHLEWIIWKLVRIMKLANKVPSTKLQLDNGIQRSIGAMKLRQKIIEKCNKKLATTNPRVLLRKIKSPMLISSNVSKSFTTITVNNQSNDNERFEGSELDYNLDTIYDDNSQVEFENQIGALEESGKIENASDFISGVPNSLTNNPSSKITENFVMPTSTLTVLKSEPSNEAENIMPSSSNNEIKLETLKNIRTSVESTTPKLRYNLRQKCKGNSNTKCSKGYKSPSYSSETTSDDSDSGDGEAPTTTNLSTSTFPKIKNRKCLSQNMKCNLDNCNKRFKNETVYQNHLVLHSQGSFACNFCPTVKTNLIQLSNHEYEMHNTNQTNTQSNKSKYRYLCPRCPFKAIYFTYYQAHFAHAHFSTGMPPPNRKESWRCNICNLKILDKDKDYHYKTWHDAPTTSTSEDNRVKKCTIKGCSAYFLKDLQLRSHLQKEHQPSKRQKPSTFQCHICFKKFQQRIQLLRHKRIFHKTKVHPKTSTTSPDLVCKLCSGGKKYKNIANHFKNFHQILEGMEPHTCDQCLAYFRTPCQLQQHKIWAHENDNKCKFCGKIYKNRRSLIGHLKCMHGEMNEDPDLPYGCELDGKCKKRFGTKGELELHQTYGHLKEEWRYERKEKFICEKCEDGKDFGTGMNLQRHLADVHGDMPFVCEVCGKGFKISVGLETHMLFHKGPEAWKWKCGECGKKCATKQKWEEHERTHTKEKPFVCQFCGERYAHRHNWRNHLKSKHGDEKGVEEEIGKGHKTMSGNYAKRKGSKKGDCILAT